MNRRKAPIVLILGLSLIVLSLAFMAVLQILAYTGHRESREIAAKIDTEIKKILDECYANAIKILTEKRSVLDNMVRVLFEKETIYTAEVDALMN